MTRKMDHRFKHQPVALEAVSSVMDIPEKDLSLVALDPNGLFWIHKNNKGALVMFFRPTGITYENRPDVLETLTLQRKKGVALSYRFSLEKRRYGPGAGGLEIHAHRVREHSKRASRLSLLINDAWDVLHVGVDLGDIGWFPREMAPIFRNLLHHYPYAITHYATSPDQMSRQNLRPSLYLCFVVWNIDSEKVNFLEAQLVDAYNTLWIRTALGRWDTASMTPAWVIPYGYGGEIVME